MYLSSGQLGELGGFGKRIKKTVRKVTKPVEKILHKDPVFKAVKKVEMTVDKEIAR